MSFAGRKEGLDFWVLCAAFRALFALEREVVGLRDGDGAEDEEEVSLSFAEGFWAVDGWRGIMPSPGSRDEGASMLARDKSGSSMSLGLLIGAMAFYDGS